MQLFFLTYSTNLNVCAETLGKSALGDVTNDTVISFTAVVQSVKRAANR